MTLTVDAHSRFLMRVQGVAHIVRSVPGPRRGAASVSAGGVDNGRHQTAADIVNAAHFETSKWPSVLLVLASVLGMSNAGEYLPDVQACGPVRSVVVTALYFTLELFFELTRREFTEGCVRALETNLVPHGLDSLYQLYCLRQFMNGSTNDFKGTKLHLLMHVPYFIRQFGAPLNWDTSSFETAHKHLVKAYYRHGSKRKSGLVFETMTAVRLRMIACTVAISQV